ncbi:MAG: beta-ketoacyl synthase N-terminal-like domain-containing protein [Cyanobacteria bacterium P01_F01_bin.150]
MVVQSPSSASIAIIGMASLFPKARNLEEYWQNILNKVDCISEIPESRWSIEDYYDADPQAPDKTYSQRGGFIPDVDFNPLEFGLPPTLLDVTDSAQVLSLLVAQRALQDAGYGQADQAIRQRTGVVLGACVGQKLIHPLSQRLAYPVWEKVLRHNGLSTADSQRIIEQIQSAYVEWDENAFPGVLGNVIAGRIANRLDLGGMNCTVDAACASSLAAVQMAVSDLQAHRSDMMISGGVDVDNSIFAYMCFSKTPALSRSDRIRPFDAESDGMLLGEGVGMIVLKRLGDAQRDGDRIYAVLKGLGSSSDGKYKSIYAPRSSGQAIALERAYAEAGVAPDSVGLVEAHGTGTNAGDPAEVRGLKHVFGEEPFQTIALGSVKSQIGHTKAAAGAASLIKATLALHHKVLPPTLNVTQPNPKLELDQSPFYLNTEARPWLQTAQATPRRAGVSAFGFGGANYHAVLEEYQPEHSESYRLQSVPGSVLLYAPTPDALIETCQRIQQEWQSDLAPASYAQWVQASATMQIPQAHARLGFVADSMAEARRFLDRAIKTLSRLPDQEWDDPWGIYYRPSGLDPQGKVVALFSGQGSQYVNMGQTLAIHFPEVRQAYGQMDQALHHNDLPPISAVVYPSPVFDDGRKAQQTAILKDTNHAQPGIGALSMGLYSILKRGGFKPDFVAGHSFGELTALWATGVLTDDAYCTLAIARGQAMASSLSGQPDPGKMLAVQGDIEGVRDAIAAFPQLTVANWNSPQQVILAGDSHDILAVQQHLDASHVQTTNVQTTVLPVAAAFHTERVRPAQQAFAKAIQQVSLQSPQVPVYANTTAQPYPQDPVQIEQMLTDHMLNPVRFQAEIEAIYQAGGSIFVECGPRQILTNLVKATLEGKPHVAVALNPSRQKDSDRQFREAVVKLRVTGLDLTHCDPYSLPSQTHQAPSKPGLTVPVSGETYGDRQRRAKFMASLQQQENHQGFPATPPPAPEAIQSQATPSHSVPLPSDVPSALDMSTSSDSSLPAIAPHISKQSNTNRPDNQPAFAQRNAQPSAASNQNGAEASAPLSSSETPNPLEQILLNFLAHQSAVNAAHQQYLQNQAEYTQQFFQFLNDYYSGPQDVPPMDALASDATRGTSPPPMPPRSTDPSINDSTTSPRSNGAESSVSINGSYSDVHPKPTEAKTNAAPPTLPVATSSAQAKPNIDLTVLTSTLLNIVSDKTGYPAEMLELTMDIEADLGIDSIKRVEILGAMQEAFPELPSINPEELMELRSLAEIAEYMGGWDATPKKHPVSP